LQYSIHQISALDLLALLPDASVHCVITDPPYFLEGLAEGWRPDRLSRRAKTPGTVGGLPPGMRFSRDQGPRLQSFMEPIAREIFRVMQPGGFLVFFCQGRLYHRMTVAFEDAGFEIRDMMAWARFGQAKAQTQDHHVRRHIRQGMVSPEEGARIIQTLDGRKTPQLAPHFEPMALAMKPLDGTHINNWLRFHTGLIDTSASLDGKFPSNLMQVPKPGKGERGDYNTHVTVKPVDLIEHLVRIFSSERQIILDPFMGSGSHGIAALRGGRWFIGCEPVEDYYLISNRRICEHCPEARSVDRVHALLSGDAEHPLRAASDSRDGPSRALFEGDRLPPAE